MSILLTFLFFPIPPSFSLPLFSSWDAANFTCSYENLAPKAYRMDSIDSFGYMTEKSPRANEARRAEDYV